MRNGANLRRSISSLASSCEMKRTPIPSATPRLIASDESNAQIPAGWYPAQARYRSVIILVLDPSGPPAEGCGRANSPILTDPASELSRPTDAMPTSSSTKDLLADNGLGARHLAGDPDVHTPRARPPGPLSSWAGSGACRSARIAL